MVFFFKKVSKMIMDIMLSLSAGIMLAASFFSLLNPSIEIATKLQQNLIINTFVGFMVGGSFIYICNKIMASLSKSNESTYNLRRCSLLFTSITLHNFPEGLAIGVAFGSLLFGGSIISAYTLTLGIAIQNFPEGCTISLPLRREGISRMNSFLFGVLSGLVEPLGAFIGALLVLKVQTLMPFILSFAAGAMLFVTVLELIPESQTNKKKDLMALLLLLGFAFMMLLEIILG